jgi:hypothetical protein
MAPPAANQPPNLNGSPDSAPNLDAARDKEPVLDQLQRNASRELESPVMAEPRHRQPRPSSGFNPRSAGIWTADQRRAEATNMPRVPKAPPNRNVGEEPARRDEIGEAISHTLLLSLHFLVQTGVSTVLMVELQSDMRDACTNRIEHRATTLTERGA